MNQKELKAIAEGLLFAAGDEGLSKKQLSTIIGLEMKDIDPIIDALKDDYGKQERGITIMKSKEIYHLTTKPEHSPYYQRMMEAPQSSRLSQAALETLAIVAYQQPITRTEIEEIRGVKSERPVQTLISRSLIQELGRKETIGRPILYGTSTDFLTYFGLQSIDELPPLPDEMGQEDVENDADLFFQELNTGRKN